MPIRRRWGGNYASDLHSDSPVTTTNSEDLHTAWGEQPSRNDIALFPNMWKQGDVVQQNRC